MEKKILTVADYYVDLMIRLSNNKENFVISTVDLTEGIIELDKELGIKSKNKQSRDIRIWTTRKNFCKFFKSYIKEEIIDETYRGNGNRMIYSILLPREKKINLVSELVNNFKETKRSTKLPGVSIEKEDTPEEAKKKELKKIKSAFPGKRLPRKDWLKRFFSLCVIAKSSPSGLVSKKQIQTAMELKNPIGLGKLLEDYRSTLMRGGLIIKMDQYISLSKERFIRFIDPTSAIACIGEAYKKWFGEDLGVEKILQTTTSTKVERKTIHPKEIKVNISFEEAYSIFTIAGLIKSEGRLLSFDEITRETLKNFNISLDRQEIIDLVKKFGEDYFTLNTHCGINGVNLKDNVDWEDFNKKFSPRNYKRTVIARIGMTMEEINKIMATNKVKPLSKISDNDFIYEITLDKSQHSLRELTSLFRTFRGNDQIFDVDLVKEIENAIIYENARAFSNFIAYSIE